MQKHTQGQQQPAPTFEELPRRGEGRRTYKLYEGEPNENFKSEIISRTYCVQL
jgi:hypothetical protein